MVHLEYLLVDNLSAGHGQYGQRQDILSSCTSDIMMSKEQTNEVTESKIVFKDQSILDLVSAEHLERLVQICSEDGMAVLEYTNGGQLVIAEKQQDEVIVIWQLTKYSDI